MMDEIAKRVHFRTPSGQSAPRKPHQVEQENVPKNGLDEEKRVVVKQPEIPVDRDIMLAQAESEKTLALINAWEESTKITADSKAHKKIAAIFSWENSKRLLLEAQIRQMEEKIEKKKVEHAETTKIKLAEIQKAAEEKRVTIESKRVEELVKVGEEAAKFRANGVVPMKFLGCFCN